VNCGAIPENLVESILFGHEKGSFTGAHEKHLGKFLEANGGTLFLDEVGELPLDMQVKLLRVLQEGEVDPIGSKRPVKVNVRIISATNKDLPTLIEEGRFREDLYYRLNVFPIEAAPLRDRREDIPALVNRFIARFNAEEGKSIEGASAQAMAMLSAFDWPGNVRQLENMVFRAVVLCDGKELQLEDFPQVSGNAPKLVDLPAAPTPADVVEAAFDARELAIAAAGAYDCAPVGVIDEKGDIRPLVEIERDLIAYAIDVYAGHMSEVARRLGIGRSTLYRKLKEYDLEDRHQGAA
jgi:DNA-binding NtrC family response regulator